MTELTPAKPFIHCFPTRDDRFVSSERRSIDRANALVDDIAERHGFALPPAPSDRPTAQQVRDRIELLRHAIPNLSNTENARLSRADLRLHELTNPPARLAGSIGGNVASTGLGAAWDGSAAAATDVDRLGQLLREQNSGIASAFIGIRGGGDEQLE